MILNNKVGLICVGIRIQKAVYISLVGGLIECFKFDYNTLKIF